MPRPFRSFAPAFLVAALSVAPHAAADNPLATITVDASAGRHAIKPEIYGVAHASSSQLSDLNVPINRHGGNPTSRYNWQANADNRGFDWYFQSLAYSSAAPGEGWDSFVQTSRNGGAQPMLTVPIIGWVAKLGPNRGRLSSFSIAKYGAQQDSDFQWFPDAGNGVKANGQPVTGNDPNDASVLVDATFQGQGVQHLVGKWGPAANGGVRYYILDNEHSIWHSTHRDVRPQGATMDEIRQKMIDHAVKIKAADPGAKVLGPEEWGWSGYFYSGADQQAGAANGWSNFPDRNAHGGASYLPWLLDQFRQYEASSGVRVIDVFTVHFYPQGGEFGNDTSTAMQQRRNRSTRALWDPNYVDATWINDKVRLIPRLKEWVAAGYPGTPVGITEWNWGAEGHINGATAIADVLGIFGREGLDMGAYWTTPASTSPAFKAFKMYRNYDGAKSGFGETSVSATGPNPDNVAVFASQRAADGAVTVMVINKYLTQNTPVHLDLRGFSPGAAAQVWRLDAGNAIARQADIPVALARFDATVPPQSITLFVIPGAAPRAAKPDFDSNGRSDLAWSHADGRSALWLMNGLAATTTREVIGAGSGWSIAQAADLDGDGKSDLVWQNANGSVVAWIMDGATSTSTRELLPAGSGWSVTHSGDFNADGKADLVFRHSDGRVALWLMNGSAMASGSILMGAASGWRVDKAADFDGDGKADLLWRHDDGRVVLWLMEGIASKATQSLMGSGSGWRVTHAVDLDGDGKADLVWQHTDGSVAAWLMNGTAMGASAILFGAGTGWSVVAAGDLDGDGKTDLVWQHTDGSAAAWRMNGLAPAGVATLLGAGGWRVKRVQDLDGDGKADLVWQHTDGGVTAWLMDGTAMKSAASLLGAGTGWSVATQ